METHPASGIPAARVRVLNRATPRADGAFVVYWMIAARRPRWSFGLDHALGWARHLGRPLVVLEALRCGYRWASARHHRFILDGMDANSRAFAGTGVLHHPYVEPHPGAGGGLLEALARHAALVVTDEFPCFFLPRMAAAASRLPVRLEAVDGNGILPLSESEVAFPTAFAFRRFLQRTVKPHLGIRPRPRPLAGRRPPPIRRLPSAITRRWPAASQATLRRDGDGIQRLPIDQTVAATGTQGGGEAAGWALRRFLRDGLPAYADSRNDVEQQVTSGLSPYLHYGHLSAHEVVAAVLGREAWTPERLGRSAAGKRTGWWGVSPGAEAFLDQVVTWRELGYLFCARRDDYDRYESLPPWALRTLRDHAGDRRPHRYTREKLEAAATHDPLWNAAQRQLSREGIIHNYLRMLWGKKILEWSATPEQALDTMIHLNNKYALDGRDPNSYSGIFWCLGRFDRPWGPERPIFGTVRYMSSDNTARKMRVDGYLRRFAA